MATFSVRDYAQDLGNDVSHLRTHSRDHEVDLLVESPDCREFAIEVGLRAAISDRDGRHLNWLHAKIADDIVDRVVITTGSCAYRRTDSVAVVSLALLGP